jgi:predicted N-formylglutamate amidohydrolase
MSGSTGIIITCEHAGHRVPRWLAPRLRIAPRTLRSHRGWDPGALELARVIARAARTTPHVYPFTRLAIDLNRSSNAPDVFSSFSRVLADADRQRLIATHWQPFRQSVRDAIDRLLTRHARVLHLSVHTFTPLFKGTRRSCDVGILFDPARTLESTVAARWRTNLTAALNASASHRRLVRPDSILLNQPYKGTDDGHTTLLRAVYADAQYAGIELEVNQRFPRSASARWRTLERLLAATFLDATAELNTSRKARPS